jgi:dTDP-4-dehydrorhamnose 3,5-epimerase
VNVRETELPGVLLIEPVVHRDARGSFMEAWRHSRYAQAGMPRPFVQQNVARSTRGVLRGMHFQHPFPQDKLVYVLDGAIFDAVVDLRVDSPSFGRTLSIELSAENARQLYVPGGFAHGYCVLSESALVAYHCTAEYHRDAERAIAWNDPQVGIVWPVAAPLLSDKDRQAPRLDQIDPTHLPRIATCT